jgi:hypothetical protein
MKQLKERNRTLDLRNKASQELYNDFCAGRISKAQWDSYVAALKADREAGR